MTTSIRITSGFCARASKTASRTLPASPTTSMSVLGVEQQPQARRGRRRGRRRSGRGSASGHRHLGHDRRAALDADSTESRPSSSSTARACRSGRARRRASRRRRSRGRRPRSRAATARPLRVRTMLTRVGPRVLDDVRQRLLDDPVERRLDLGGQARRRRASPRGRPRSRSAPRTSSVAARARARARSRRAPSGAARRRGGARPAASSTTSSRSSRRRLARASSRLRVLDAPQAEQDRGQRLPGLVVELAGEPLALELLRVDDTAQRVPRDALERSTATAARVRERLGEPQVVVGEARVRARACRAPAIDADRAVADESGTKRPVRAPSRRAKSWSTSGSSISESTRSLRRRSSTRTALRPLRGSRLPTSSSAPLACGGLDRAARPRRGSAIDDEPGADAARAAAVRRGRAARGSSISPTSALPTSFSDSSWRDQRVADS